MKTIILTLILLTGCSHNIETSSEPLQASPDSPKIVREGYLATPVANTPKIEARLRACDKSYTMDGKTTWYAQEYFSVGTPEDLFTVRYVMHRFDKTPLDFEESGQPMLGKYFGDVAVVCSRKEDSVTFYGPQGVW